MAGSSSGSESDNESSSNYSSSMADSQESELSASEASSPRSEPADDDPVPGGSSRPASTRTGSDQPHLLSPGSQPAHPDSHRAHAGRAVSSTPDSEANSSSSAEPNEQPQAMSLGRQQAPSSSPEREQPHSMSLDSQQQAPSSRSELQQPQQAARPGSELARGASSLRDGRPAGPSLHLELPKPVQEGPGAELPPQPASGAALLHRLRKHNGAGAMRVLC